MRIALQNGSERFSSEGSPRPGLDRSDGDPAHLPKHGPDSQPAEPPQAATISGSGRLEGTSTADTISGSSGADILIGHGGGDRLNGGEGADVMFGDGIADRNPLLSGVKDFAIIYQGSAYDQAALAQSDHDLIVINPARVIQTAGSNPDEEPWTAGEIAAIGASKLVIAYLDVAKINDYLDEWNPAWTSNGLVSGTDTAAAPAFLRDGVAGPNLRLVDFWEEGWRELLHHRIDNIVAQGFDGLFLDDVLEYYVRWQGTGLDLAESARDMRDLIIDLSDYARARVATVRGDAAAREFIIIENGGPELIVHATNDGSAPDAARDARFYASIDGFLAESYFSGADERAINIVLREYGSRGITLFSADRNIGAGVRAELLHRADDAGFIPTAVPGDIYDTNPPRFHSTAADAPGAADVLVGGAGDDRLIGGGDADTMQGGVGSDRYWVDNVGDKVIEASGQGGDTVDASVTFSLAGQYVEALNLIGAAAINGSGNSLDNRITGNGAANTLNGAAGNDRLDGGAGADKLIGGIGNDVFVVDNAGDVITENSGEGADTVEASISYSLAGQYLETLKLIGNANINATGNGLANTLLGNAGANVLNGVGGADTMSGGGGDDRYIVDDANDKVVELANQGTDLVESSVSFSLAGQYVENLTLTGSAALNGTGNGFANRLTANGAANTLNGGAGDDALHGGLGSDVLTGGTGLDCFWFETTLGSSNVDRITDFYAADDTIHLDRTIFSGMAAVGALSAGAFRLGSVAIDADDRILYDKATGNLYYDADGTGGVAAKLFAQLAVNTAVTAADFFVDA